VGKGTREKAIKNPEGGGGRQKRLKNDEIFSGLVLRHFHHLSAIRVFFCNKNAANQKRNDKDGYRGLELDFKK